MSSRDYIAATLTVVGTSTFLLGAGLGLVAQESWFVAGIIVALVLLTCALVIGSYVPKRYRNGNS